MLVVSNHREENVVIKRISGRRSGALNGGFVRRVQSLPVFEMEMTIRGDSLEVVTDLVGHEEFIGVVFHRRAGRRIETFHCHDWKEGDRKPSVCPRLLEEIDDEVFVPRQWRKRTGPETRLVMVSGPCQEKVETQKRGRYAGELSRHHFQHHPHAGRRRQTVCIERY